MSFPSLKFFLYFKKLFEVNGPTNESVLSFLIVLFEQKVFDPRKSWVAYEIHIKNKWSFDCTIEVALLDFFAHTLQTPLLSMC